MSDGYDREVSRGEESEKQTAHVFRGAPGLAFGLAILIRLGAPLFLAFGIGIAFNDWRELFAFVPLVAVLVWDDKWAEWAAFLGGTIARLASDSS